MKKIALVGLFHDNNLGDPLMVECVEYFYKKIANQKDIPIELKYVDLFGRKSANEYTEVQSLNKLTSVNSFLLRCAGKLVRPYFPKLDEQIQNIKFLIDSNGQQRLEKYFYKQLKEADLVVVVGGALIKFRLIRDFHNPMHTLVKVAHDLGINVFFNAAGVENGYDLNHPSCRIVEDYLNYGNVKMVTTRDDFETLAKYVKEQDTIIRKSSDTAVWCDEVFGIEPNYNTEIIGIGVIEPKRFIQYEQGITEKFYEKWLSDVIKDLDRKGYKWKLFTNGHVPDYDFACKLAKQLGFGMDVVIERPVDYRELVMTINSFKMIVASRLHACIIAYGFDKPIVGIDWNDKVIFFGDAIEESSRFFKPRDKTPEEVVDIIEATIGSKYNKEFRATYRNSVIQYIEQSFSFIK